MHFLRTPTQSSKSRSSTSSITDSAYSSVDDLSLSAKSRKSASTFLLSESLQYGMKFFSDTDSDEILRQSLAAGEARKEEMKRAKAVKKMRLKERLEILEAEREMEVSLAFN